MGTKTAAEPRLEIPLQNDGRADLQALAAVLSSHVEQRHRDRGTYPAEPATEPECFDLTETPELLPVRVPDPFAKTVTRGIRRAVPLLVGVALTAIVTTAAWTTTHAAPAAQHSAVQPQASEETPTTPAQWGAAAHKRLTRADRPVDVFACQAAYAADATIATATLPPASTNPDPWQAYLAACLSDMSGSLVGRSG